MLREYAQHDISSNSSRRRAGFTLIEMLTTVAVLIIVLGLMVSLARHVRNRSATLLTRDVLAHLDVALANYRSRFVGQMPPVRALALQQVNMPGEQTLLRSAEGNNADF